VVQMAPASTIMVVPSGRINNVLLPRLVAIWWISSVPGFHAGRALKTGAAARRSFAGRLSNAARASELSRKRRRGSDKPTYRDLATGWENRELESSNLRQSPEAVLIDFQ